MDPGQCVAIASPSAITQSNQAPRELVVHDRDRSGREQENSTQETKNITAPFPHSPVPTQDKVKPGFCQKKKRFKPGRARITTKDERKRAAAAHA